MKKPLFTISAPGRVCLFGEHSDYLGLPVITMAIDKRLTIACFPRKDKKFRILMPDIYQEDQFIPSQHIQYKKSRDYLRAGVNVLKRKGCKFSKGYDFFIKSKIPIGAGTSSSSALVVAWIKTLLSLHPTYVQFNPIEIARLAFETEVLEFKEPGGRMDHFAIAMGKFIYHENHETIDIHHFQYPLEGIVLGHSLEKKETIRVLKENRREVTEGFRIIKKELSTFHVKNTPLKEIVDVFGNIRTISDVRLKKAFATLKNRDLCQAAFREFVDSRFSTKKIGRLMNEHHHQLKTYLNISTPKIERMIEAVKKAGALGAKINGSGLGGTMIAYAPGREEKVCDAIESVGGKAWIVQEAQGVVKW